MLTILAGIRGKTWVTICSRDSCAHRQDENSQDKNEIVVAAAAADDGGDDGDGMIANQLT